ncbi:thiamine-phosphate kinase [Kushneria phosphatilytica]|uniref:Thiamine-monophosphate kinase n=1 Tax=Kushneria phosphatilytica TaxID=657387 RepID=A0A1S1NU46_9GAMM|nr:thiamine-phosphate kinase [Kushneria phosphatilytica]OHV09729.1 thiamine-phosphate kinase [Kushneria phosphatilytica]QEL11775.1 thiamine-phosphate kinase [Kushneria phosphatilytica]
MSDSQRLGEFDLIRRFFVRDTCTGSARRDGYGGDDPASGVALGQGDDCALLTPTPGWQLAVSVDTSLADVHFPADAPPEAIGHRALAVNLSDLAAMGASPRWYVLALTLPDIDTDWLEGFARGLHRLADHSGIRLVGGDVTRGSLSITITVHGEVPAQTALRRDGAGLDELIVVTGPVGGAHGGLRAWQSGERDDTDPLLHAYLWPSPALNAGEALRGLATSAIDVSDGVVADLAHICRASGVGARIDVEALPLYPGLAERFDEQTARQAALTGGDDYVLLCTLPEHALARAEAHLAAHDCTLTVIGRTVAEPGIHGVPTEHVGWQHFDVEPDDRSATGATS